MIELQDVRLSYGDQEVLSQIDLQVHPGECVLLTGKSGSGKSSLLEVINGLAVRYDQGKCRGLVQIGGVSTEHLELYQLSQWVATVFQNPKTSFFNVNTTLELVSFLENMGISREEMERRLEDLLTHMPIGHLLNRNIFALSGGERQLLALAAAYISGVKRLVLDEPSSNLDAAAIDRLGEMLAILKEKGVSLLLAEHRLYYALSIVDRVLILEKGRIVREASREDFKQWNREQCNQFGLRKLERLSLEDKPLSESGEWLIEELTLHFSKKRGLKICKLPLKEGQIYGVVGPNGIGKSTFLRAFVGLEKGMTLSYQGRKLSASQRRKLSSWVMQDVNHQLFSDQVFREMFLGNGSLEEERVLAMADQLELSPFLDRYPLSLSGGQKQRLAIASALLSSKLLVFLDEPTSGMDAYHMRKISEALQQEKRNKDLIIVVSHDVEFLNRTVDQILDLSQYVV